MMLMCKMSALVVLLILDKNENIKKCFCQKLACHNHKTSGIKTYYTACFRTPLAFFLVSLLQ